MVQKVVQKVVQKMVQKMVQSIFYPMPTIDSSSSRDNMIPSNFHLLTF